MMTQQLLTLLAFFVNHSSSNCCLGFGCIIQGRKNVSYRSSGSRKIGITWPEILETFGVVALEKLGLLSSTFFVARRSYVVFLTL